MGDLPQDVKRYRLLAYVAITVIGVGRRRNPECGLSK